jgi:hypothetical protein
VKAPRGSALAAPSHGLARGFASPVDGSVMRKSTRLLSRVGLGVSLGVALALATVVAALSPRPTG